LFWTVRRGVDSPAILDTNEDYAVVLLVLVLISLFAGLYFMYQDKGKSGVP